MTEEGLREQSPPSAEERHPAITAAAILFFLNAGWVVAFLLIGGYVVLNGDLPRGWENLAPHGRIYDAFGADAALAAYGVFACVSMIGVLAGLWLWRGRRAGAGLGAITLAVGPVFWYGFGLPIPPFIGLLQVGLLVAGWKTLR
jgi:hypothetical protein